MKVLMVGQLESLMVLLMVLLMVRRMGEKLVGQLESLMVLLMVRRMGEKLVQWMMFHRRKEPM